MQNVAGIGPLVASGVPLFGSAGYPARTEPHPTTKFPSLEVTSVTDESRRVVVETTGGRFLIERSKPARIQLVQKINGPRDLCQVEIDTSFANLTVAYHDHDQCDLYVPFSNFGFKIRIQGDSLLDFRPGRDVRCHVRARWLPEYSYSEGGNLLFLDRTGGYSQHVLAPTYPTGGPIIQPQFGVSFSSSGWETYLRLPVFQTLLGCVAPPREFDWRRSVSDRIVHHSIEGRRADGTFNYFPADSTLEKYSRYGNVLVLSYWERGAGSLPIDQVQSLAEMHKAAPWCSRFYAPLDEREFRRTVRGAQGLGMRVLPYLSPLFFPGTSHEFLGELKRLIDLYPIDGFYFDGVSGHIRDAYEIMKGARHVVGPERLLYVHISSPPLGSLSAEGSGAVGRYAYCPFIDTYADFILRGEHDDTFDDTTLRYTISGYNSSNAIGFVCNYDYRLDFNRRLIRNALDYNVRVPWWDGFETTREEHARVMDRLIPPMSEIHSIMTSDYFPALDRLQKSIASSHGG